ncbi:PEP-CTERM sorting domain-containing protein [Azoarcus indigens]|uniref:Putative secreted protein n=1 Tax=Azoarcus indigens TaxID=29545 RepID=A0A4R6EF11_9RHOO|nr:PEP-CTERM sorting domain-containing protein [Azoarcus indigens]NMG66666.1 PEP-CTERM sorting domain-containing protein [Azoarcus indigens]TDN56856.1 putative secreted protein [Azoarcus indigens]
MPYSAVLLQPSCNSGTGLRRALAAALLALLPGLASLAHAAPLYRYTYTGLPYSQGDGNTYGGGNTAESFLSAEITSRIPLAAGLGNLINTPGLSFRMWDDNSDFTYQKTVTPYHFEASIIFAELDAAGVPISWELSLQLITYDPDRLDPYTHGLYSSNWAGAWLEPQADTNSAGGRGGADTFGASFNNPGSWQLTVLNVQALPEPASSALLLGGLGALALLRKRRRAAQP